MSIDAPAQRAATTSNPPRPSVRASNARAESATESVRIPSATAKKIAPKILASRLGLREAGIDAAELLDRFDPERVDQ